MKQYLPMKPTKRGFKVWVRADAVTGYFCEFEVYVGRPSDGTTSEVGLGERVVLQLTECLRGGNYQIFCDNYFTTCHLLDTLLSHQLYGCGTTRPSRREFPRTLQQVQLERGQYLSCQRGNLVASLWMDKKQVTTLSTLAQADATHTVQRRQRDGQRTSVQCTDAVVLYNRYMGGVDKGDQLHQYYRIRTKCMKNYKYLFCFGIDVAITNGYILSFYLYSPCGQLWGREGGARTPAANCGGEREELGPLRPTVGEREKIEGSSEACGQLWRREGEAEESEMHAEREDEER